MKDGGPAFPFNECGVDTWVGMTLRDYFAAQAIAGLVEHGFDRPFMEMKAKQAYDLADAMLAERGRER